MAKRRGGFGGGGGGTPNMGGMMKQIQKMQDDMREAQEALADETVEVSVGGGAITVVITGHQRIQAITINKDVIDTDDAEWVADLQDMLVAAMNQAVEQSQVMAAERMEEISGGLGNIPGISDLLGGM